jgi:uncharacterized protein (DUF427 family)
MLRDLVVLARVMSQRQVLVPGPDHPITVEPSPALVTVTVGGREVASSSETLVLREADYPPVHYFPLEHVDPDVLVPSDHATYCPFKGDASYYSLDVDGRTVDDAVWTYRAPHDAVSEIAGHVAFYERLVDRIDVVDVA